MTVRTLHHYDEIGLLRASERTAAGHRRYTAGDLGRLYRVRALRALGMSLVEIKDLLDSSPAVLDGYFTPEQREEMARCHERAKASARRMWQDHGG